LRKKGIEIMETTKQTLNQNTTTKSIAPAEPVTVALQSLEPLSLTPEGVVEYLRALRAQVPQYGQLESHSVALLKNANVDPNFIQATANAAGVSPLVQQAIGTSPETLSQEAQEARRWTVVEDEVRALLKGVVNANLLRRHRIGTLALQGYGVAKQLARIPEHSDLLPHVTAMQKMNKFSRLRRKVSKPAASPEPAPVNPVAV
jgi:hypothetical protein